MYINVNKKTIPFKAETMSNSSGAHILIFPFPAQGHMIPLLDFSCHLSKRGLSVTILVTLENLPILNPLLSKSPSIQTLVLPFPKCPSIPSGVENTKDLPPNSFLAVMRAMAALHDPILRWFRSHPSPPVAIISDFFLGWTHHLACQLSIPRVVFWPSSAHAQAFSNCLWRTLPKLADPSDVNFMVSFPEIPNSPKYPWWQLSNLYRKWIEGDPDSEFVKDGMLANMASWCIVFNSFNELEGEYLEYTRKHLGHTRVWAVGPLLPSEEVGSTQRAGSGSMPAREVMSWLDRWADCSVIYVCFGSQAVLTRRQMEILADALEASGAQFLWGVKEGQSDGGDGVVPTGFDERVAGRGLVIRGWVPQVAILGHRAVGSFLTHCGWNSVLEGIVAGVPMLAWPRGADQFLNATLVVDQMGIGKRVCEGGQSVPDSAELARALANSVSGFQHERVRVMELSRAAFCAVRDGGSSSSDMDAFVKELCAFSSKSVVV